MKKAPSNIKLPVFTKDDLKRNARLLGATGESKSAPTRPKANKPSAPENEQGVPLANPNAIFYAMSTAIIMKTSRIPKLSNVATIAAFFEHAEPYDYTVTQEEFDEVDGDGPGRYCGVEVPEADAAKWNAGLHECKGANIDPRSIEGIRIRLAKFGREDRADGLFASLEQSRSGPIITSWKKETAGAEIIPLTKIPGWVIVLHPGTSPIRRAYALAVASRAEIRNGGAWVWRDDQYDDEMLTAIRAMWEQNAPGWVFDRDGKPESDELLKELHSGSAINHHLCGDTITSWPKASCYNRVVVAAVPAEVPGL